MSEFDEFYLDDNFMEEVNLWDEENNNEKKFSEVLKENLQNYSNFLSGKTDNFSENNYYNSFSENINSLYSDLQNSVQNDLFESAFWGNNLFSAGDSYNNVISENNLNNLLSQNFDIGDFGQSETLKTSEIYKNSVSEINTITDSAGASVNVDLSNMVNNYSAKMDINGIISTITEKLRTALTTSSEGVHS